MSNEIHGIGIGFRYAMAEELLQRLPPEVRWVEVHPENYMRRGGRYADLLSRAREHWPLVTHGLTMCFASSEPQDDEYMDDLSSFLRRVDTPWHSDHACFGSADGAYMHDLLPVPFTDEAAKTMVQRIVEARDAVDRPIAVENVSYYAPQAEDGLLEADFMLEVLERADAKLLLDVNNVFVNSVNFGFDPRRWIDRIPPERVVQMHVAGHFIRPDGLRIDTHGESICEGVYDLLEYTLKRMGKKPVLLERDNNIPPLDDLLTEVRRLSEIYERATEGAE